MDCYIGIDLGSTTTKAIYMATDENVLGRGITNSRSNYKLACEVASDEAEINARFNLLREKIGEDYEDGHVVSELMEWMGCKFKLAQHLEQTQALKETCQEIVDGWEDSLKQGYKDALHEIFDTMDRDAEPLFRPGVAARSDFFRDIASSQYLEYAEKLTWNGKLSFDRLTGIFDRAILLVEGHNFTSHYQQFLDFACAETAKVEKFSPYKSDIKDATHYAAAIDFNVLNTIGTGYGRQTLPFPKHQIRSEILCHGLGAHVMFPDTRTVLDIGGQDTKAIQVDPRGIVTNFQMNDRCAAGCGRYLGYIADEMSMGVHELGPLALKANKTIRINSTCTVFAGAELRERLAVGEMREDILAGLHRAMILRAMSLLARSGGICNEFTFTGGVAKNQAATKALKKLIEENYGDLTVNISPDSIYTGARGAALFAKRDVKGDLVNVDLTKLRKEGELMFHTVGIDVGCSSIKTVIMSFNDDGGGEKLIGTHLDKIRKRNVKDVIVQSYEKILAEHGIESGDIAYVATTGEGELVDFRRGHFYSMTTHARGALFLMPEVCGAVDVGALHAKAFVMDNRSKVLSHRMTSQCASGSGQFLENISRYLGVSVEEIGPLSLGAAEPEMVSGICAVLGETDVINMVSRGISAGNILKGVHISIAKRLVNLLRALKAEGPILITGGLASDPGFVAVMQELSDEAALEVEIRAHALSVLAGAIGAAIWGGFRHVKLQQPGDPSATAYAGGRESV